MPETNNPSRMMRSRRVEFSTRAEGDDLIVSGYFVVFDQPYYIDDSQEEVIKRGAFDDADMDDVRGLVDHLSHLVLGRSTAGTLDFQIEDTGIYVTIRINRADQDALNLYARVQRGDVDQASFGFDEVVSASVMVPLEDGRIRWEIHKISKLWEFSVCTFPAYEQTFVEARARQIDEWNTRRKKQAAAARKAATLRKLKHHRKEQ